MLGDSNLCSSSFVSSMWMIGSETPFFLAAEDKRLQLLYQDLHQDVCKGNLQYILWNLH